jgi:hypothetical protein
MVGELYSINIFLGKCHRVREALLEMGENTEPRLQKINS